MSDTYVMDTDSEPIDAAGDMPLNTDYKSIYRLYSPVSAGC